MLGEQQQQVVPGSIAPLVYSDEEEMRNGHNGDVPPQPKGPVIEEPETDLGHPVRGFILRRTPVLSARPSVPLA